MNQQGSWLSIATLILFLGCSSAPQREAAPSLNAVRKNYLAKLSVAENQRLEKFLADAKADKDLRLQSIYPLPNPLTEETLYERTLSVFERKDTEGVEFYNRIFEKKFRNGSYIDNAMHLLGSLYSSYGLQSEALRVFEKILKVYPKSNKVPGALLGKAICFRKLGLREFAERSFADIQNRFPGSPESREANAAMKLMVAESAAMLVGPKGQK